MTHAGDFIDVYDVVDGKFQKIGRGLVVASGRREEMSIPVVDIQFGGETISRPIADVKLAGRVEDLERVLKEVDEWADFMGGFDIQKKIKRALGKEEEQKWLCWEAAPMQQCPCGEIFPPKEFLAHLEQCGTGLDFYRKMIKKLDVPATRTVPKFKSIRADQVKGRGTIITVDLAADLGTEGKKLERLLHVKASDPDAVGDIHVEIDGVECVLIGVERNSANTLAGLVVKELKDDS